MTLDGDGLEPNIRYEQFYWRTVTLSESGAWLVNGSHPGIRSSATINVEPWMLNFSERWRPVTLFTD